MIIKLKDELHIEFKEFEKQFQIIYIISFNNKKEKRWKTLKI
jgi:hypothetical protein